MTSATEAALAASSGPALIVQARNAVARAQARAGITVVRLDELDQQREAAAIWQAVWDRDGEPPVSAELVRAVAHAGNYVSGAYAGGRMVGALLGFYAGDHGVDHVHSHILGVDGSMRGRGVGFALKLHQRVWALERGLTRIDWTFDPLVRGNAFFNVTKLAARGVEYLVDFYGAMTDTINSGDESDRVVISWELDDPRVAAAAQGIAEEVEAATWRDAGAVVALDAGADGRPLRGTDAADILLCRVPTDVVALRMRSPELAREWRHQLRAVMGGAMARGLSLHAVTRDGWYVLAGDDHDSASVRR